MAADDAAVVVTLRANLKDYEAALRNAVRSTERAAKAAETAVGNIGKGGGAGKVIEGNFKKSTQAMANDARVLSFQLNDIFSGLASGQGMRAVQVQLGQIAQQMTGTSLVGGARLLGAAFVSMINPINLAVVAFGVLAGVAASYFADSEEGAKKAADALKKQADELDNLAKKYGALFPALKEAAEAQKAALDVAERNVALQKELALQYEKTNKTVQTLTPEIDALVGTLETVSTPSEAMFNLLEQFSNLSKASKENRANADDLKAVIAALNKIIAEEPGIVADLATALRDKLAASLNEVERAAKAAGEALTKTLDFLPGSGGPLDLSPLIRARAGVAQSGDVATMTGATANFIRNEEGFRAKAYWDVNAWRIGFGSDTFVDAMGDVQKVTKDTVITLHQANQDLARRIPEFQQTITNAIGPDYWQSLNEAQQAALTSIAYNFGSLPKSIVEAIKAGDKGQVAKAIEDLGGNKARRGREAAAFGGAPSVAAVKLTAAEKAEIKAAREEAQAAQQQFIDQLKQQQAALDALQQQMEGAVSSALTGFAHDLMNGVDAGEAFQNMLKNLASQIADMAIKMLIVKPLMNSLFGGFGGAAQAGLFEAGGTVGLSGRHDGRKFSPALWAGAPRFAAGGMVGLRPGEVPIIAHRGEIVIPNARRIAGASGTARGGEQTVKVMVSAAPSPLLDLSINTKTTQAERRAVARGPGIARDEARRFGVP